MPIITGRVERLALLAQLKDATFFGKTILTGFLNSLCGFLYGEGLITPAISILSVEGLRKLLIGLSPLSSG